MLERELKNKIDSTLSDYKNRCDKLEDEINVLKSAIYQLSLLPNGIYVGLDRQMHNLQTNIQENKDSNKIKKSVELLVNAMSDLRQKKQENKLNISEFVKKATNILGKMIVTVKDQKTFEYVQKLIHAETDEQALLVHFTQILDDSVNWVNESLNFCQHNHSQLIQQKEMSELVLNNQISVKLGQLLKHLVIPESLAAKLVRLQGNLAKRLTVDSLDNVVNNLTDLVIEAFNLEHSHLKGFLNIFAANLQEFGSYLQLSTHNNLQTKNEVKQLEKGVQSNIKSIRENIEQSKNIKVLSNKVEVNLESIAKQIKTYRRTEIIRIKNVEEKISSLQAKLTEMESIVDNIKLKLSSHKIQLNRDFLTGLPNRVACEEYLLGAFHRWERGFGEISMGLVNIDHFKTINDKYGYLAGDAVLKQIGTLFRSSLRAVDFVARYSGEEFIIILEHTPPSDAWAVFDKLRIAVEETAFNNNDLKLSLTVSFGLSIFQHGDTLEKLFVRVNEAMNQAKHAGRNQTILNI
ncbi:MAG: diguanylate cyclase [Tatlockia sp.]|nr:diguanylate cyclase [Tatlockia sp.]